MPPGCHIVLKSSFSHNAVARARLLRGRPHVRVSEVGNHCCWMQPEAPLYISHRCFNGSLDQRAHSSCELTLPGGALSHLKNTHLETVLCTGKSERAIPAHVPSLHAQAIRCDGRCWPHGLCSWALCRGGGVCLRPSPLVYS